jgi:Fungal specific transcription factor domain/Fungal Zn(2)-Cys(6) binuclear cluster domain
MDDQTGQSFGQESAVAGPPVVKTPVIPKPGRSRGKRKETESDEPSKRKCVSTACIACRKRKSKCDGNLPACAACASVYYTECVYDPNSDHRRKGVYRKDEKLKTRNTTLEILIQALLNAPEEEVTDLVQEIRTCESLDTVAEALLAKEMNAEEEEDLLTFDENTGSPHPTLETQLSTKMGDMRLEEGSARYIGGTSNLLFLAEDTEITSNVDLHVDQVYDEDYNPITSWTRVTDDPELVQHLLTMYFTYHYTYFTTLSKQLFFRDFRKGQLAFTNTRRTEYCTPLLVNAMLALGCHFTAWPDARTDRDDSATAGDHFFHECKRLIMENDEYEKPKLATVQALALMSVREAGCGRESKGWVYSGMSFRMAGDLGLNLDSGSFAGSKDIGMGEEDVDARRITFWGCFLFDK